LRRATLTLATALSLLTPLTTAWNDPARAVDTQSFIGGYVNDPDGHHLARAQIRLWIEEQATGQPAEGTVGTLIGPLETTSTGAWAIALSGTYPDAIRNPDGSITVDGEVTSADGTYDKLFNFNVVLADHGEPAVMSESTDEDQLGVGPGAPATGIELTMSGVDPTPAAVPNDLTPAEHDYSSAAAAYAAASADESDEAAIPGQVPVEPANRHCDQHQCWVTGDPGPCNRHRAGEDDQTSYWARMPGDDHTQSRWVPVQAMYTQTFGREELIFENGQKTQMSVVYAGYGKNFKGGLSYSSSTGLNGGASHKVGHNRVGYFALYWQYRKFRQWCSYLEPGSHMTIWRDTGKRKWQGEDFLGSVDGKTASVSWPCNKSWNAPEKPGDKIWATRTSSVTFTKFFSIAGVGLDSHQTDDEAHQLILRADEKTWWCPDSSTTILKAMRVQEQ
jgi:hypothetical protein